MFGGQLEAEIVGVVPDLFTTVRDAEPLALYLPISQTLTPVVNRTLVYRAGGDVEAARREVRSTIRSLDATLDPAAGLTIDEELLSELAPQQFGMRVLGALGGIALLLTLLGTYVLAESAAARRTREMGIRGALGATAPQLVGLMVRDTCALVGPAFPGGAARRADAGRRAGADLGGGDGGESQAGRACGAGRPGDCAAGGVSLYPGRGAAPRARAPWAVNRNVPSTSRGSERTRECAWQIDCSASAVRGSPKWAAE